MRTLAACAAFARVIGPFPDVSPPPPNSGATIAVPKRSLHACFSVPLTFAPWSRITALHDATCANSIWLSDSGHLHSKQLFILLFTPGKPWTNTISRCFCLAPCPSHNVGGHDRNGRCATRDRTTSCGGGNPGSRRSNSTSRQLFRQSPRVKDTWFLRSVEHQKKNSGARISFIVHSGSRNPPKLRLFAAFVIDETAVLRKHDRVHCVTGFNVVISMFIAWVCPSFFEDNQPWTTFPLRFGKVSPLVVILSPRGLLQRVPHKGPGHHVLVHDVLQELSLEH